MAVLARQSADDIQGAGRDAQIIELLRTRTSRSRILELEVRRCGNIGKLLPERSKSNLSWLRMGLYVPFELLFMFSSEIVEMYVVEMRFTIAEAAVRPSDEVLMECIRNGVAGESDWLEHVTVQRLRQGIQIAAFVMATSSAHAGQLGERIGAGLAAEVRGVCLSDYRVWRNDTFDGQSEGSPKS